MWKIYYVYLISILQPFEVELYQGEVSGPLTKYGGLGICSHSVRLDKSMRHSTI